MQTNFGSSMLVLVLMACWDPALAQRVQLGGATGPAQAHPKAMTNADVIGLAAAGMDDAIILAKIRSVAATDFDSSVEGLKALKAGGVSNDVIRAIVANASITQVAVNSDDPNVTHPPGVYALVSGRDGQVQLLMLEHTDAIGQKMSGNSLTMAYGLSHKHVRTSLTGRRSPIQIDDRNPSFYIYIPDDASTFGGNSMSVRDFALIKLKVKSKVREVETASVSMSGMGNQGINDSTRQVTVIQKVRPGIYMVKLNQPLKPGEYAFEHELEGVFYDFGISETGR